MNNQLYSSDDVKLALDIFHRAVMVFDIPPYPQNQEEFQKYLREDGSVDIDKIPRRTVRTFPDGLGLHFLYSYDGFYTVEADYFPVIAILGFIESAREQLKVSILNASEQEIQEWTENEAYVMTLTLISKVYQRMDLALRNHADEVITNWQIELFRRLKKIHEKHGEKSPRLQEKTYFRNFIKNYENNLMSLWFDSSEEGQKEARIQFAKDYPSILKHWQKLRRECGKEDSDWREYAKAGKFIDTPDDLIDKLEDCRNISSLALEHAARRAGLSNPDANENDMELRKGGIYVTGYTTRQLHNIKKEGQKFLNEVVE